MNKFNNINGSDNEQDNLDFFSEIDFGKIIQSLKQSIFWIILLSGLIFSGAFLYLRYTKPKFSSSSLLKLSVSQNQELTQSYTLLGSGVDNTVKELSGEIQFLTSNIVIQEVIDKLNLRVSYYAQGNILEREIYGYSPFKVDIEILNDFVYDKQINVRILSNQSYELSYELGQNTLLEEHKFGEEVSTPFFKLKTSLIKNYSSSISDIPYFFIVNSNNSLFRYFASNLLAGIENREAKVIRVSFNDYNAKKAQDIVATMVSVYMEKSVQEKNKSNRKKIEFLNQELKRYDDSLLYYQSVLQNFYLENKTKDIDQKLEQIIENITKLGIQKNALFEKRALIRQLRKEIESEEGNLKALLPLLPSLENDIVNAKIKQILEKEDELKTRVLRENIDRTSRGKKLRQEMNTLKSDILLLLDTSEKIVTKEILDKNVQEVEVRNSLEGLPAKSRDYNRLSRLYNQYETYHSTLLSKRTEFEITGAGIVPEFIILAPATASQVPISPDRVLIYLFAGGLSVFMSIGVIGLNYLLHDTITSQAELEKSIRVPVLGTIPEYRRGKLPFTKLVVTNNPKSSINEALRSIRTNIDFMLPSGRGIFKADVCTVISITSTISGEGKTFVASNLGGIISLSDLRVIILDFDMRKPKLHIAFDAENDQGVSSILIGKKRIEDCVQHSEIKNLDFISSGPTPPNPSELILREDFDILLDRLKKSYDVIIIDTPPVGLVTDGILIMQKVDMSIYVLRANYSKKAFRRNIHRLVSDNNFTHLSVIFNAVKNAGGRVGYGYGYGYGGYHHGYYEDDPKQRTIWGRLSKIFRLKK